MLLSLISFVWLCESMSSIVATRSLRSKDWTPTRITTRSVREPRDERARIPGSTPRPRPTPINVLPGEPSPLIKAPPSSQKESQEFCESPRDPEIIDVAAPNTWPRRGPPPRRALSKRKGSPSTASEEKRRTVRNVVWDPRLLYRPLAVAESQTPISPTN